MIKFQHAEYLWWLIGLLPLTALFIWYWYWRVKAMKRLGDAHLVQQLSPERARFKLVIKFILLSLASVSIILGLANLQVGTKYEKVKRSGVDIIIALDVSKSMLAEDLKPNRLERAKQFISRIIDRMQNDRIGLIVFAGRAYLQMPVTIDYGAAKLFLKNINTDIVPVQGTAIDEAISLAMNAFEKEDKKNKVLIIISDGEHHEGDAMEMAELAAKEGITIFTLGVGSPKGAPIPEYRGKVQADFKRDGDGNIVLTKLNETMLQQIAVKGNGQYFRMASGSQEMDAIMNEIAGMEKKDFEERVFTDYEDQFQYFLALALLLLTAEYFITEKRSTWWQRISKLFKA